MENQYVNLEEYELIKKIGDGSFGEVYTVRNKISNQIYAAKISLKSTPNLNEKAKKDIKREIKNLSSLNHPSIIQFIGYNPINFLGENKPVIITEYLSNGSLRKLIESAKNGVAPQEFNFTKKIIILYGIASGMNYLHSLNILHRDLKPENILIDIFLYPKICDFGLSKNIDESKSSSDSFKGTFLYMAPEVLQIYKYSQQSDVYAFGMTAYELLTLQQPFEGKNLMKIILSVGKGERPALPPSIDDSLQLLIKSCWNSNPNNRPSFTSILDSLRLDEEIQRKMENKQEFLNYVDYVDNKTKLIEPPKVDLNMNNKERKKEKEDKLVEVGDDEEEEDKLIEVDDDEEEEDKLIEVDDDDEEEDIFIEVDDEEDDNEDDEDDNEDDEDDNDDYNSNDPTNKLLALTLEMYKLSMEYRQAIKQHESPKMTLEQNMIIEKRVIKDFTELADKGNSVAMLYLGIYYENGYTVVQDLDEALKLYDNSQQLGNKEAKKYYKRLFSKLNNISFKEKEDGKKSESKKKGFLDVTLEMHKRSMEYRQALIQKKRPKMTQEENKKNEEQVIQNLTELVERGHFVAMCYLGIYYENGYTVRKNKKEALTLYKRSELLGNEEAKEFYDRLSSKTKSTPVNAKKKKKSKNKKKGFLESTLEMHNKSMEYRQAVKEHERQKMTLQQNKANERLAIKNFTELADKGNSAAMLYLGIYYENGYTVVQDLDKALNLYKRSQQLGNKEAKESYNRLLSKIKSTSSNAEEENPNDHSKELFKSTLEMHKKSMEYRRALIEHKKPKMSLEKNMINERQVIKNFTELADKGNSVATLYLGIYYENGYTVVQDLDEALKLYDNSQQLGNKEAKESYDRLLSKIKK